jgi:glycerophosphoryl diester phosphodiesterase
LTLFVGYVSSKPLVIGHRGACGYRPEHTLESYRLAIRLGADYIEPDLVPTRDGVLVARHENEISATTDVAEHPEFARRHTTKVIDGVAVTGWFTEDFTLAELRALRAMERLPDIRPQNTLFNGRHPVPTFQEVIDLASAEERRLGRPIGIYPETKHPSYHRSIGLALEPALVEALRRNGLDRPDAPVFVQSFEAENLRALRGEVRVPLVQLVGARPGGDALATPEALRAIAEYADAVGPAKERIVPLDAAGASGTPTTFVEDAHRAGLQVHPYTFRRENAFLPAELRSGDDPAAAGDLAAELRTIYALGVDAVFSDHPDVAVKAR